MVPRSRSQHLVLPPTQGQRQRRPRPSALKPLINPERQSHSLLPGLGNTTIALGDITLTVDSAELSALEDFTDITVGSAGTGDGQTVVIGYLAAVSFANADGLSQDGEGY